ncbi:MAG: serine/threonine protein kinase, partial [Deltaproteobacteria bacterium]|nr:serine/threonine protein kinase [Deltaproteobacteria bacterium]
MPPATALRSAPPRPGPEPEPEASSQDPYPLGAVVDGRYALRRILGRGGAAVVFAAENLRVRRPVALKLPLRDPDLGEILSARLRRETDALSRVRHPVIVDVVDAGESDGVPFLAMELLEGRTLSGLVAARGRLAPAEVVKIGLEVAAGLSAVHAVGLVHRDVKPGNILITRSPVNQVHLFDFGIARIGGAAEASDRKLTQSGAILGTPEYMPMEALVSSPDADGRVDQYALGVTLFECLTGSVPFEGQLGQILLKVATESAPDLARLRPDVPPALVAVIARCLAREPGDRFPNLDAVLEALLAVATVAPSSLDLLRPV